MGRSGLALAATLSLQLRGWGDQCFCVRTPPGRGSLVFQVGQAHAFPLAGHPLVLTTSLLSWDLGAGLRPLARGSGEPGTGAGSGLPLL